MPRFRRVVVPGFPHHVTDRGNRRSNVFLDDSDRLVFLRSLQDGAEHSPAGLNGLRRTVARRPQ